MSKSLTEYLNPTLEEFKSLIKRHYNDVNFENDSFISELFDYVYLGEIKGIVSFQNKCYEFFKLKRTGTASSKLTIDYWLSRGYTEDYAKDQISQLQMLNSPTSVSYWLKKGLNEKEAIAEIKKVQSKRSRKRLEKYTKEELSLQSIWSVEYWKSNGYTEEEATHQVKLRNYGCREFWSSDTEYENVKKIIAKKTKNFIKNNPELYKSFFGSVSKEEISFFKVLKDHVPGVIHNEFIVNVKSSPDLDKGIIKYDGYLKVKNGLILIEYDGIYWHNQSYDEVKDEVCLGIRPDVIGILRISSERYIKDKQIIKHIKNAIDKIKNKECNRVKLY